MAPAGRQGWRQVRFLDPRAAALSDVPTIAEAGVSGYEADAWMGLLAPSGTAPEIIARLHREVGAILSTPDARERLATEGVEAIASTPEQFGAFIRAQVAKWAKVVKNAGIQPE